MDVYIRLQLFMKGVFSMAKKRINIYVEEDTYKEFKSLIGVTGDTITAVFDQAMKEYINAIKMVIEAGDKDSLMAMLQRRLDVQITNIEGEIDTHLKAKK